MTLKTAHSFFPPFFLVGVGVGKGYRIVFVKYKE